MIYGDIQHFEKEKKYYPAVVRNVIDYISKLEFGDGSYKKLEIEGEDLYAVISTSETVTKYDFKFVGESHEKYIDIHYCVQGEEAIVFSRKSPEDIIAENLLETKDALLYSKISHETKLIMTPGRFAVFFPSDIHLAGYKVHSEKIRKVTAKIRLSLLDR